MVIPQKIKNKITIESSNSILGIHPKEVKARTWTDICTPTFNSIIYDDQKVKASQVSFNR